MQTKIIERYFFFGLLLTALFSFMLMLLSIFYFLKDGERWKKTLITLSPLSDTDDKKIVAKLSQVVNGVIKGYLLMLWLFFFLLLGLFILKLGLRR